MSALCGEVYAGMVCRRDARHRGQHAYGPAPEGDRRAVRPRWSLDELREVCAVHGWDLKWWDGATQQEPVASVSITIGRARLRAESADGLDQALLYIGEALNALGELATGVAA